MATPAVASFAVIAARSVLLRCMSAGDCGVGAAGGGAVAAAPASPHRLLHGRLGRAPHARHAGRAVHRRAARRQRRLAVLLPRQRQRQAAPLQKGARVRESARPASPLTRTRRPARALKPRASLCLLACARRADLRAALLPRGAAARQGLSRPAAAAGARQLGLPRRRVGAAAPRAGQAASPSHPPHSVGPGPRRRPPCGAPRQRTELCPAHPVAAGTRCGCAPVQFLRAGPVDGRVRLARRRGGAGVHPLG